MAQRGLTNLFDETVNKPQNQILQCLALFELLSDIYSLYPQGAIGNLHQHYFGGRIESHQSLDSDNSLITDDADFGTLTVECSSNYGSYRIYRKINIL